MVWVVRVPIGLCRVSITGGDIASMTRIRLSNRAINGCIVLVICLFFTVHCDTIDFYSLISLKVVIGWVVLYRTSRCSAQRCGRCDSSGRDNLDIGSISWNRRWRNTIHVDSILLDAPWCVIIKLSAIIAWILLIRSVMVVTVSSCRYLLRATCSVGTGTSFLLFIGDWVGCRCGCFLLDTSIGARWRRTLYPVRPLIAPLLTIVVPLLSNWTVVDIVGIWLLPIAILSPLLRILDYLFRFHHDFLRLRCLLLSEHSGSPLNFILELWLIVDDWFLVGSPIFITGLVDDCGGISKLAHFRSDVMCCGVVMRHRGSRIGDVGGRRDLFAWLLLQPFSLLVCVKLLGLYYWLVLRLRYFYTNRLIAVV